MKEQPASILVVDDDAMILALIERILKLDDHVVSCARGSKVAIERLRERDFDLVLLDATMPSRETDR